MQPAPIKPTITIEDLQKIDIRVGTIESADEVEKSDKLVRLTVDFGDHKRIILAGLKQELGHGCRPGVDYLVARR